MQQVIGFKNRFLYLLLALILFFIFDAALVETKSNYISNIVFTITILASLFAISDSKRPLVLASVLLGIAALIVNWSGGVLNIDSETGVLLLLLYVIFFTIITIISLATTLKNQQVTENTLYGAVCTYLLIGLTASFIYQLIFALNPQSFMQTTASLVDNTHFIYYSFVTLTTLGYGDTTPTSSIAQLVSWVEAVTGQVYLTMLIAELVGAYISQKNFKLKSTAERKSSM